MISLFLDTCNHQIFIGLLKDNKLIDRFSFINDNNLSEKLLPSIKEILDHNSIDKKELNEIYVSIGPGSFTGIRIGVTVAKTMAWSLKIKIIPVSSLEVMASTSEKKYICPIIDARRGYVYAGLYDNKLNNIIEDKYINLDELLNDIDRDNVEFISYDDIVDNIEPNPNIEKVINKHCNDEGINPHSVNPIYLKRTEAEEKNDNRS